MTSNKQLIWVSLAISVISLIVSIIVLVNYCPTQNLKFDYLGVIVGMLALLVTSLIGAQVGQYVFVDRKIEKITRTLARVISRKVAQEVAYRETPALAKSVALDAIDGIVSDFSLIMKSQDLLYRAKNDLMLSEYMSAIDNIFEAIANFVQCKSDKMSESSINEAMEYLNYACVECKKHGGARILEGRKDTYLDVLKKLAYDTKSIRDYLNEAKNMPKETDYNIREKEDQDDFEKIIRGEILNE